MDTAVEEMAVVSLEAEDDFSAVRERILGAGTRRVLLVVPRNCRGLSTQVHLRLLERFMTRSRVDVGLVTEDGTLIALAREMGIPAFLSEQKGREAPWPKRERAKEAWVQARRPLRRPAPQRGEAFLLLGLLAGTFVVFLVAAFLLGPSATVIIKPATYRLEETFTLQADPLAEESDFSTLTVPAEVMEVEVVGQEQMPTTAKKDVPDVRATGEAILVNKRSEPTTVVSETVLSTSAGMRIKFRTMEVVTLPGYIGAQARVPIEALDPGPGGNVAAWSINRVEGLMALQVRVVNDSPTTGGTVKQISFVTEQDKTQLRNMLMQRLKQEGYNTLTGRLGGAYVPMESLRLRVLTEFYDRGVGEEASFLTLDMGVLVTGTAFRMGDAEELARIALGSKVGEGFQLLPKVELRPGAVTEMESGAIAIVMEASGGMILQLDQQEIRGRLAGRSADDAIAYLEGQLELVDRPEISMMPSWWPRLPWIAFRISLFVVPEE